ncbi:MAG: hypothetical protein E6J88_11450 [Deltaproteobacteria bacterium]|nr:MAG: hypothetical protein E6J88_11450 [Deltaproteobacteria bacterium]
MRVVFVEQPGNLPAPPSEGRVAVVDVAFAGGDNFEKSTVPFLEGLGNRLAIWIDHHEHPAGWARYRDDPRFVLVPNRIAHACPELVTPEVVQRAGPVDVVVAHADLDGLLSAVKFIRGGSAPWPEADEDARAADSPGRGHAYSSHARVLSEALDYAAAELRSAQRESLRQEIVAALVAGAIPAGLQQRLEKLAREHEEALAPVADLSRSAREEAGGVLVARVEKALPRPVKKALLSRLEERAPIGVVVEGRAVTAATFRDDIDLALCDELTAGRSDYRFAQASDGGKTIVARLAELVRAVR